MTKWLTQFIPRPYLKIESYQGDPTYFALNVFVSSDEIDDIWGISIVWMTPRQFASLPERNQ